MPRNFKNPEVQAANDAGAIFYADPDDLQPEQIDPLLWPAVTAINASGWIWTAESCQGHPDYDGREGGTAWPHNTKPMLRLVTRDANAGRMLHLLAVAAVAALDPDGPGTESRQGQGLELWPAQRRDGWFEVLVYIKARNVAARDAGCKRFEHFGRLVAKTG